jgi:hypothetical protein
VSTATVDSSVKLIGPTTRGDTVIITATAMEGEMVIGAGTGL